MDFTLDDEQRALRDAIRALGQKHVPAYGAGDAAAGPARHDVATWGALAEVGALGLPFPEAVGGFGATVAEAAVVATELGRAGVRTVYADALVAGSLLASSGESELLEKLAVGEALVLPAISEPGRAWSLTAFDVVGAEDDGSWTLTGTKSPVLSGSSADHVVVAASVDGDVGLFVVDSPGLGEDDRLDLDGTPARLLARGDAAAEALERAVALGITVLAAEAVGAMDSALTLTVEYLKTRKQFGVPLMTFQTLTQRSADMYTELELARSTALFAAMTLSDDPDDTVTASRAKVVIGQAGRHVGQEAIQLHGGIGMTAEYAVGHHMARLTAIEHSYGDTRWHLASLAATLEDHGAVEVLA